MVLITSLGPKAKDSRLEAEGKLREVRATQSIAANTDRPPPRRP